jgi:hypothetical protein
MKYPNYPTANTGYRRIVAGLFTVAFALALAPLALAPAAHADVFDMCPGGREGVVGGHTTCAFADNVRSAFYASGMSQDFIAYSPVTGDRFDVSCAGMYPARFRDGSVLNSTRCYAGDNAEVVLW